MPGRYADRRLVDGLEGQNLRVVRVRRVEEDAHLRVAPVRVPAGDGLVDDLEVALGRGGVLAAELGELARLRVRHVAPDRVALVAAQGVRDDHDVPVVVGDGRLGSGTPAHGLRGGEQVRVAQGLDGEV